jgi:hypothetical protein
MEEVRDMSDEPEFEVDAEFLEPRNVEMKDKNDFFHVQYIRQQDS